MSRWSARLEGGSAFGAILAAFVACQLAESVTPDLRYAKYLLPVIALGIAGPLLPRGAPIRFVRRELRDFAALAAIAIATSLVITRFLGAPMTRARDEAYFVMAPLITSYLMFPSLRIERISAYVDWLFFGVTGGFVLECGWAIINVFSHAEGFWVRLLMSTSAAESSSSFVFGLLTLYYLFTGRRARALWAAGLMMAGGKRIAIVGSLVCGLLWAVIRITRADVRRCWRLIALLAIAANTLILVLLHSLSVGTLDEIVSRHTGMSANWFTMGRETLYATIFSRFEISWSGSGLGAITSYLQASGSGAGNPHSDVIKYAIEVGPLLSAVWVWALYRLARGSAAALLLVLYTNVVFISDNVSIYFGYMFVLYLLIGFLSVQGDSGRALWTRGRPDRALPHDRAKALGSPAETDGELREMASHAVIHPPDC